MAWWLGWVLIVAALSIQASAECSESCEDGCVAASSCSFCKRGGVTVMCLKGSMEQMGRDYGAVMAEELVETFDHLEADFGALEGMLEEALIFDKRYSASFRGFLRGIAEGSGLPMAKVLVLNAMETLTKSAKPAEKTGTLKTACLFARVPAQQTAANASILLRNYDFPPPFDRIARNLVVAVLHAQDKVPTAIIGMPGQVYCPTCVNRQGLFLQLNNGMPSGGFRTNFGRRSMLIKMLEVMQDSETVEDLSAGLRASQSDYSLVLNAASPSGVASHEFASFNGSHQLAPIDPSKPFVSTNYFLSEEWGLAPPSNLQSWWAVLRRRNMLRLLAEAGEGQGFGSLERAMELPMVVGGAKWSMTIYQLLFRPHDLKLSLRSIAIGRWQHIDLKKWF